VKKTLGFAAAVSIAVLAGCSVHTSMPSPTASPGRLSGTMNQWVKAVCNSPLFDRGTHLLRPRPVDSASEVEETISSSGVPTLRAQTQ
jgi:hypothetical protein